MCWICDSETKRLVAEGFVARLMATLTHDTSKLTSALEPDGVGGDLRVMPYADLLITTTDDIPDSIASNRTITVDGPHIVSTIDTIGDQDFFKVELVAGRIYDIGQFLVTGGPSGTPLADAYLELYDATGKLLVSADGGGPNTPSGLDALLTFIPQTSGTYYINARAWDASSRNGRTGDFVGDYEVFVKDVTEAPRYKPYYDLESPLHALDWGSQVDRTSRNPDGEEGPRVTGNAFTGVGDNPFGITGKNVITVYFAKAGDIFVAEDPTNPGLTDTMVAKGFADWEKKVFFDALNQFSKVADIVYVEVDNRNEADFKFVTYVGTPGYGPSLLGRMSPPNEQNEGQAEFNAGDRRWTASNLQQGGFSFVTLIHELGHGHGLAHPHDTGGRSSIMRGVFEEGAFDYSTGEFNLNQGINTMMSYEDGWQTSPYGNARTDVGYGYLGGLSAFDIAVIQDKYGVNEEWATGDDVYTLKDVNAAGTFFSCIWDAGGNDTIAYDGARDTVIDLRAATLRYEEGGGGWMSYAFGIYGGFTIANGVTIENARSGAGNDRLVGNDADNALSSGAGNDAVDGRGGNDRIEGGLGRDTLTGGTGNDVFVFAALADSAVGADRDLITDFAEGDKIDLTAVGATTFIGVSQFTGRAGEVRYAGTSDATVIELDADGDGNADLQVELKGLIELDRLDFVDLRGTASNGDDELYGTSGADSLAALGGNDALYGLGGDDHLDGGAGADVLVGGLGRDTLIGGAGADLFRYESPADSPSGAGRDRILDFVPGSDRIDLSALGPLAFVGKRPFTGAGDELRYSKSHNGTLVEVDFDGDKIADFQIEFAGSLNLSATDFVF